MREIGSEFWDVTVCQDSNGLFQESVQWFLSGRSALKAVINDIGSDRTVALPSWCCESMIVPFLQAGWNVRFYSVKWEDTLHISYPLEYDVLFLMDYFGYATPSIKTNGHTGIIIRDLTHSIFSGVQNDADYYFGSLRKWCGIWTGGYAWTQDGHWLRAEVSEDLDYIRLRQKAMQMKQDYISNHGNSEKMYLDVFHEAEEMLEKVQIACAADRDIQMADKLDVDLIRKKRRRNAALIREALRDRLVFPEMRTSDCPLFVPILLPEEKRDKVRRQLIQKEIYCPIHWPISAYHPAECQINVLYKNELSLVCDQRYTIDDMERMIREIYYVI
ncbi:MAG: hypothetical protein K2I00_01975 [Ruminococcus sp.]|nr:hypothetical protein [Ruminococcus sp.]